MQQGSLYLECIDPFEDIFELKQDMVEGVELTNLLDPYMFSSHRDIINALFETYFSIGDIYLNQFYDPKEGSKVKDLAKERVMSK